MEKTAIQTELDNAEIYFLTKIFGNVHELKVNNTIKLFLLSKKINLTDKINEIIEYLEAFLIDYLDDDGIIDGERLTTALVTKFPLLSGWIALPSTKPIDYVKTLDQIIGLEALGRIIRGE